MKTRIPQYRCKLVRERTVTYPVPSIQHEKHAAAILHAMLDDRDREHFCAVYLNGQNVPVGCEIVSIGGLHWSDVDLRTVFKGAILAGASSIVVGHNHPSGNPEPSAEDLDITSKLAAAGKILCIPVVDHIIVTRDGRHTSFYEKGLL